MSGLDAAAWFARLERGERELGLDEGFKLLYSPWSLIGNAPLALLSLNPGAKIPHGEAARLVSDERGNTYAAEREKARSPISEQFFALCEMIGVDPEDVLTGVAIPYRSRSWSALTPAQRQGGRAIGLDFWRAAFAIAPCRSIIVCGAEAARLVVRATEAREIARLPSGWGKVQLRHYRDPRGRLIVHLPQLSRFQLFSRAECAPHLSHAFGGVL